MDATTNHQQHQDGSPMQLQQPPSPSKKRKQHQIEKTKKSPFEKRMDDLRGYKERHGHINIKKSEDESLNKFCNHIRQARNNPEKSTVALTENRIASLNDLGFDWAVKEQKSFAQRIDDLRAYKEKHGHVNVKESGDKSLYGFCSHMRQARNNPEKSNAVLTDNRIASLVALGFEWTVQERGAKSFEQRLEDLRLYKGKHGHIRVKQSDTKYGIPVGTFLMQHLAHLMNAEELAELTSRNGGL